MRIVMAGFMGALLAGCAGGSVVEQGPLGSEPVRYGPVSRNMEATEGDLALSATLATFSKRKGVMELHYGRKVDADEIWQDSWFGGTGGPEGYLYKVTDAEAYFEANKDGNGVGDRPVRWLAVSPLHTKMSLCEVVDEAGSIAPDKPTVASCGVFERKDVQ